jgi:hypothetical protein
MGKEVVALSPANQTKAWKCFWKGTSELYEGVCTASRAFGSHDEG